MKHQSWLGRLLRRAPQQQNLSHPIAFSSTPSPPPRPDEETDPTEAATVGPSASLDPHASPAPSSSADVQAAGSGIWHIGDVILDQYEVRGILGEGGMGTVYLVHHRGWNMDLAVKSPRPELFANKGGRENFIREAQTWVNLPLHPHIVSCYYVRTLGEVPRIFAEYVAGGSLVDWIKDRRLYQGGHQFALERMLDIAIQFAWGLHASHEQGLVHQDIKPANVMITTDGVAKVTDFGLAKARAMAGEAENAAGMGTQSILVSSRGMTPAYCSPEQAAGQPLSRKTDIWNWAVSLLEMFVGGVTWQLGAVAREVLASHEAQDVVIPRMPAELVKLLAHCFELRPEDRPATMLEVSQTLQEIYAQEIGQPYSRETPQTATMLAGSLNNLALSLYELGKVEEAVQVWEQALQADPQHLESTYNRGVVLWRAGEVTDEHLVRQLEMLLEVQDERWQAAYLLAQVHLERGDMDAALPLMQEAAQQAPARSEVPLRLKEMTADRMPANRCLRTFKGHTDRVISLSLSADGRWLASGSNDDTARLWEVSTGRCLYVIDQQTDGISSVSLSADGRWLATGRSFEAVELWEVNSGRHVRTFQHDNDEFTGASSDGCSVSLSRDGCWLASGRGDEFVARLWETITGRCVCTFEGHDGIITVCLSANGRWLVSGGFDDAVRLWETSTGRCVRIFEHPEGVYSVSLSADERWLVTGGHDRTVRLWEVSTGRCLWVFEGKNERVIEVSLSADGRWLVSSEMDGVARLWETSTGRCVRTFEGRPSGIFSVSLSTDGCRLVVGRVDGTVQLWHIDGLGICGSLYPSRAIPTVTVSQTESHAKHLLMQIEQMYSEARFTTALKLLQELRTLPGWERNPKSREASAKLSLYCKRVSVLASWKRRTFQSHTDAVASVSLSTDGYWLASGSDDQTARLWEVSSGRCVHTFKGHNHGVTSVSLSTDGRLLASGSDDRKMTSYEDGIEFGRDEHAITVCLWEANGGHCLFALREHATIVDSVSLSADRRWLVSAGGGKDEGTILLWEVSSGRCVRIFQGHTSKVTSVSLSADGYWLASIDQTGIMRLWDVRSGRCMRIFQDEREKVSWVTYTQCSVSLSADGRLLASAAIDEIVRLWEVSSGRCMYTFQGHASKVMSVSLSADGRWLVSGSTDRTVRLWDVNSGRCAHVFEGYFYGIPSVSLSADGRWLASASGNEVWLWELDWELEAYDPTDWDEGARSYLEIFLTQHTPLVGMLPQDREPTAQEIQHALTHRGTPTWNEEDFQGLIRQLQYGGYGWLRPEGVRRQLERMASTWQGPPLSEAPSS